MRHKRVIIIGAGVGGLSAAIVLAHKGYQVTILEKNKEPGGRIGRVHRNGFTFDQGASMIMLSEVFRDFFASVDRDLDDYISMDRMNKTTTFYFNDGRSVSLRSDIAQLESDLRKAFPDDIDGFKKFMHLGSTIYNLAYRGPQLARRNYHKLFGLDYLLDPHVLMNAANLNIHRSWMATVNQYMKDDHLRFIFSYQAAFMGMHPKDALGTYAFLPWAEITDGMYAVKGGTYGIIEGLIRLARELGVTIRCSQEVTMIDYQAGRMTRAYVGKTAYDGDIFINNTDGAYFYTHLMPQAKNTHYPESRIAQMKHTNAYFTINLGLKAPIKKLGHHSFFVAPNWREGFDLAFTAGQVPRFNGTNTTYYLLQPTISEPSLAPKGKATAFILQPVCGYDPEFDWASYTDTYKSQLYDIIEQRDGIPIRQMIEEEIVMSPSDWGQKLNLWQNVTLGFSLNFFQANGFRMPNKSREFSNLYFAGSSTIPGPGVPTCISSGQLTAQRILDDYPEVTYN